MDELLNRRRTKSFKDARKKRGLGLKNDQKVLKINIRAAYNSENTVTQNFLSSIINLFRYKLHYGIDFIVKFQGFQILRFEFEN